MADEKAREAGNRMLQNLLPLFGAEKQAQLKAEFDSNPGALEELGKGAMRQDEFSRGMAQVQVETQRNETWRNSLNEYDAKKKAEYAEKERLLQEQQAAFKAAGGQGGTGGSNPPAGDFVTKADAMRLVEDAVSKARNYADNYGALINKLSNDHYKEFGEFLDTEALLSHVRTIQVPIDRGGYESFVKERRAAKQAADQEKALKDAEQRGFERGQRESNAPPYVSAGFEGSGGVLAGLADGNKPDKTKAVANAVATYQAEIAKRGA